MPEYISIIDLIVPPLYLILLYFVSKSIQRRNIANNPSYRYYMKGLMAKVIGGIAVCFIYVYYYGGGDTLNYYNDTSVLTDLFLRAPDAFLKYIAGPTPELISYFDPYQGYPIYFGDKHAIVVVKLTVWLCLISFKSYIGMTILLAWISYWPIWRLYQVLIKEFPTLITPFAYALFFIPSVFFWGSGLLKDTITFSCVCLYASSYSILITSRKEILKNLVYIAIASTLMVWIKPYIFFALLPGSILWYGGVKLSKIENKQIQSLVVPFIVVISLGTGYLMLTVMGSFLGEYSLDRVLDKAVVTQQDLKNERYQGSSYDIGDFDPTVGGILSKAPAAINAALFRPYITEVYNFTMLLSGIENTLLLAFTIYLLIRLRIYNVFRLMFRQRILFFTVFFSIFFSFSVGLTTSNFGSLVRYKIPAIPFFLISLIIISHTFNEVKAEDKQKLMIEEEEENLRRKRIRETGDYNQALP